MDCCEFCVRLDEPENLEVRIDDRVLVIMVRHSCLCEDEPPIRRCPYPTRACPGKIEAEDVLDILHRLALALYRTGGVGLAALGDDGDDPC